MPTRILREGIITSEKVNSLSHEAELFYRRLMSVMDDYGRYFAHPSILRAACYPLQLDRVSEANVKHMLNECTAAGLLVIYNGGKHLHCPNFGQQTRSPSKYPQPTEDELLIKCTSNDKHLSSLVGVGVGDVVENGVGVGSPKSNGRFAPPSLEEVKLNGAKIGLPEAECIKFRSYYESNGWKVGRNPMKCWRSAMIHWRGNWQERNRGATGRLPAGSVSPEMMARLERTVENL